MANLRRLTRLVKVLEDVRDTPKKLKEFDLQMWSADVPGCGTHFCAGGWGAVDPVLKAQGLHLSKTRISWRDDTRIRTLQYRTRGVLFTDFDAAENFFQISRKQTIRLFAPGSYDNVTDINPVIKRVKSVIKRSRAKKALTPKKI